MEITRRDAVLCCLAFLCLWTSACGLLSTKGVNYEAQALMGIKDSLHDPHAVLNSWNEISVDPCCWALITCSSDGLVIGLGAPSQNLSGSLAPSIGNLTNLQLVLLQGNNISGHVPSDIGRLLKLRTLDLSNNNFMGPIPTTVSHMKSLQYLRLNNNSLAGEIPLSLSNMSQLAFLDLSYNNLSGSVPHFHAKTFKIVGNPLICATGTEQDCFGTAPSTREFNNITLDTPNPNFDINII